MAFLPMTILARSLRVDLQKTLTHPFQVHPSRPLTTAALTEPVLINSITPTHLKLSNEVHLVPQQDLLIPSPSCPPLLWKSTGISLDSLQLFQIIHPRPDLLIIGTGSRLTPLDPNIRTWVHSLGIQLSVLDSRNAASTYNLLVDEGRSVAVALQAVK
ncbi:hypothetical protein CROQUDRAFT_652889 [Cronartium quercuum f. sp. fusiforme G11]|uniref:NADH dehydrogenase [ubiquinone] 1 alpha subcomplex assembly factor 3 n=1 Tax=Cronartium quercuum f. sp. fusiforme G11 TaxID=708437 RepID=A0A9P6NML9_9BASI|nr:hypothetical protein CROQUDRAFT_652889 [Cronartium quercuum f. sp. fusiforme G11]